MKVIAHSAWTSPEVFTVKSKKQGKKLAARLKHQEQKLCEVLTEKEYRDRSN